MIKQFSGRFIIIPLLLLAGFIGMFCVIEYRKHANDDQIRLIIDDPIPDMAHAVEVSALHLRAVYEMFRPTTPNRPQSDEPLQTALEDLAKKEAALSAFLMQDAFERDEHLAQIDGLKTIRDNILLIRQNYEREKCLNDTVWQESQEKLEIIIKRSHMLTSAIDETHQKEITEILDQIAHNERQRALLAVFVLITGLVLVLALLDVIYHHKNNAERAKAAEKCNAIFAAALQNTRVGVLIRDMRSPGQPVVFINSAFTRLTGYEYEDVTGDSSGFLFGWNTDQAAIRSFKRAVQYAQAMTLEALLYRKDGSPFWAEWNLSPLMGDDGNLAYFVSLFGDLTSVRQTQEELIQAKILAEQASAIKTNFLAMMSHEIRTPINGILGILKLLGETDLDAEQKHLLGIAATSSSALHLIINDILDYAKMEAGRVEIYSESFSLHQLLEEIAGLGRSLIGDKPVQLMLDIQTTIPPLLVGDAGRLRQIFLNLMSNAIKFTDTGFVRIRAIALMQQEVEGKHGYLMRFEVHDSGIGISTEDQHRLFQDFSQVERSFTRRFGGTGLGLAICRRLVTMMNGEIGVESQQGHGSRFWFMIPMQEGSANALHETQQDQQPEKKVVDPKDLCVLLVEDNDTNRLVAKHYLDKIGVRFDEASDGVQAIEFAKSVVYDLILMDVSMPVMDGMMATRQIRTLNEQYAKVPIIALTAHAMEGDRELCLAAGMNDYLSKPIEYRSLVRTLERWMPVRVPDITSIQSVQQQQQFTESGKANVWEVNAPVFDPHVLRRMKDDLGGRAVDQVTQSFLTDSAKRILMFEGGDIDAIREAAHTLKSSSASCGLKRVSVLFETLEGAAKRNDVQKIHELLALVPPTYATAIATLVRERINFIE